MGPQAVSHLWRVARVVFSAIQDDFYLPVAGEGLDEMGIEVRLTSGYHNQPALSRVPIRGSLVRILPRSHGPGQKVEQGGGHLDCFSKIAKIRRRPTIVVVEFASPMTKTVQRLIHSTRRT